MSQLGGRCPQRASGSSRAGWAGAGGEEGGQHLLGLGCITQMTNSPHYSGQEERSRIPLGPVGCTELITLGCTFSLACFSDASLL